MKYGESKVNGVRHALEAFGLSEEAAAVVGDDLNDLDMIIALNGWAMSSSRPEVLAKANHTCKSIADLVNQLMT
ncbi:MAG: HAD hydrolase family protein [Clostridiales bacterium]|nr:HAD hydrolase family protein [Clostridiales bacterium]